MIVPYTPLITILITTIVSRIATKSWLSPASFFSVIWFFFITMPIIFAPDFSLNFYGISFISLILMSFSSGGVFALFFSENKNRDIDSYIKFAIFYMSKKISIHKENQPQAPS